MGRTKKGRKKAEQNNYLKGWKYYALLIKIWADTGLSLLTYPKILLQIFGIAGVLAGHVTLVVIGGILGFVSCVVLGWGWYQYGWAEISNEIGNKYNPFVKSVRDKLKKLK